MRRLILSSALVSVLCIPAIPVFAQVYKWVDEKGVVNYSNEAPVDRKAKQLDPKSSRVSIIASDETQRQLPAASASDRALAEKIDRLERKLDAERYARSVSEAQAQTAADSWYQQCLRDRRVDCDAGGMDPYYGGYGWPYYGPVAVKRPPFRDRVMHHRPPVATPKSVGHASFAPARSM
ncbi:MAG TPA: DUF4124 domain-containing protein [Burkholderiales bacterium]|nr:DUF4124 domain-containing protein [Burkholderiales bacterium]